MEIEMEELDWNDLKRRRGIIDSFYDNYGNWWLMFTAEDTGVIYILDFKPLEQQENRNENLHVAFDCS